jgi:hypothetical protein
MWIVDKNNKPTARQAGAAQLADDGSRLNLGRRGHLGRRCGPIMHLILPPRAARLLLLVKKMQL